MIKDTNKEKIESLIKNSEIKISKIRDDGSANINIIFDNFMEINGFTICKSKFGGQWIQPPKYGKKFNNAFYLSDKNLWNLLENKIEEAYEEAFIKQEVTSSIDT